MSASAPKKSAYEDPDYEDPAYEAKPYDAKSYDAKPYDAKPYDAKPYEFEKGIHSSSSENRDCRARGGSGANRVFPGSQPADR
jgi:hypothetical protein